MHSINTQFNTVDEAIVAMQKGEFVIVVDNLDRENEGDLIIAADQITADKMAFLVRHSTGIVCVAMEAERLEQLDLPLMVTKNTDPNKTAFTISVDYTHRTTTGVSAQDRSLTLQALANPKTSAKDFHSPGHIFPLKANKKGVLGRQGHTEAAIDLCRLAHRYPAGVLCDLFLFAEKHQLKMITIADLLAFRRNQLNEIITLRSNGDNLAAQL
jgi:3,4-dihydroxy 2-butanone 4-phosphate synthase/GTP cyclohydrolase II